MRGWVVPPPKTPVKTAADFARDREEKVRWLEAQGWLKSARVKAALLKVRREDFIPPEFEMEGRRHCDHSLHACGMQGRENGPEQSAQRVPEQEQCPCPGLGADGVGAGKDQPVTVIREAKTLLWFLPLH
jgi:hypothetical protein